jgi:hypothetical protein
VFWKVKREKSLVFLFDVPKQGFQGAANGIDVTVVFLVKGKLKGGIEKG